MTKKKTKAAVGVSPDTLEMALNSLTINSNATEHEGVSLQIPTSSVSAQVLRSASYFDRFPEFTVDNSAPLCDEFNRLAKVKAWGKKKDDYKEQRLMCLTIEFDRYYGHLTTSNLEAWQNLCAEVVPDSTLPQSVTQCRKVSVWKITHSRKRF